MVASGNFFLSESMFPLHPLLPPPTLECECNIWSSRSHLGFRNENVIAENKRELKSWNNTLALKFLHPDFLKMRENGFISLRLFCYSQLDLILPNTE